MAETKTNFNPSDTVEELVIIVSAFRLPESAAEYCEGEQAWQ